MGEARGWGYLVRSHTTACREEEEGQTRACKGKGRGTLGGGYSLMETLGLVLGKKVIDFGSTVAPLRVNSVILKSTCAQKVRLPSRVKITKLL